MTNQRGVVVWLYGLSGSGKSTLANEAEKIMTMRGNTVALLDGDNLRSGINADLDFSVEGRREHIRRTAEIAKMMRHAGLTVIATIITPLQEYRDMVKEILGDGRFLEVYVKASPETCKHRDPKGLYQQLEDDVDFGNFPGINSPFDTPINPDLVLDTEEFSKSRLTIDLVDAIEHSKQGLHDAKKD